MRSTHAWPLFPGSSGADLPGSSATDARARRAAVLQRQPEEIIPSERLAVAHIAAHDSARGASRHAIRPLADVAWADGRLLEAEAADRLGWHLVTTALLFADELERAVEIADAALTIARERGSSVLYSTASYSRMWPFYDRGRIAEAAADAQATLDARPDRLQAHFRTAYGAVACCHIQRGELVDAERALMMLDEPGLTTTLHYLPARRAGTVAACAGGRRERWP